MSHELLRLASHFLTRTNGLAREHTSTGSQMSELNIMKPDVPAQAFFAGTATSQDASRYHVVDMDSVLTMSSMGNTSDGQPHPPQAAATAEPWQQLQYRLTFAS